MVKINVANTMNSLVTQLTGMGKALDMGELLSVFQISWAPSLITELTGSSARILP